jgi:hypothetical protein
LDKLLESVRQGVEMIRGQRAPSRSFKETDLRILEEEFGGPRGTAEWDKHTRPPANVCPGKYCFLWVQRSEAIGDLPAIPEGRCECGFGVCTRLDPVNGEGDFYEPCEPELEDADLPWFYFMDPTRLLASPFRKKYLRLVRELWGDDHHRQLEDAMPEATEGGDAGTKGTGSAG